MSSAECAAIPAGDRRFVESDRDLFICPKEEIDAFRSREDQIRSFLSARMQQF